LNKLPAYSMVIRWSDEDAAYIVTLPEFDHAMTHGDTYEQAAKMGRELIESFIVWYAQDGKALPEPSKFVFDDVRTTSMAGSH
jgi:antitoxin HicB